MKPNICLILGIIMALAFAVIQGGKVFLFPEESDTAYVELAPKQQLNLKAFTLCMRLSTELQGKREIILFAYRTNDYDELNVWRELDGRISLYLSSDQGALYTLPSLSTFQTHLCLTWKSRTGLTAFWVNGQRSMLQVYRQDHTIRPGGTVIIGQDPDSYLGGFNQNQSFVGEITDVGLWDYVLPGSQIKSLSEKQWDGSLGNIICWNSVQYKIHGNVIEVDQY